MERFDERDNVFGRCDVQPGTPEYEDLYRRHPEWREADDDLRSRPELGQNISPADMAMFDAPAWLLRNLGEPDCVDGVPSFPPLDLSSERATLKIKKFAGKLGADLVGVSRMKEGFAYSHRGRITYPEEAWGSPIEVNHHYAISLGFWEDIDLIRTAPQTGELVETAWGYYRSAATAVILAQYIRSLGYPARAHHFRNYQVLPVPLAIEAGLGQLGRCGFLVTKQFGNCLRLSTVTTNLPLICDGPVDIGVDDFCRRCRLCADACPSGAIPRGDKVEVRGARKWRIDEVKCYNYWTKAGTDCGLCIASCPWSEPDAWIHRTAADWASRSKWARIILLWLYPIIYGKYQPRKLPDWFEPMGKTANR